MIDNMSKDLLIASIGLALFIICPRMAGMVNIIAKYSQTSLDVTALFGTIISIPLVLTMVLIFAQWRIWGALAFCILTDLCAALFIKNISAKAGMETILIALFVILGVKLAPWITGMIIK